MICRVRSWSSVSRARSFLRVVEQGLVFGELGGGQPAGDGLAADLAGPFGVGAVQPGRVGVAAAAGLAAGVGADGEGAGQGEAARRRARRRSGPGPRAGLGLVPCDTPSQIRGPGCCPQYITVDRLPLGGLMQAGPPAVAGYIARWRPWSVSPRAAAFARDVITAVQPGGQERAKNLLWAAAQARGLGAAAGPGGGAGGAAAPVGGRAVHPVRAGAVRRWRGGRCARTCGSSAAGWCRSSIRRICRCRGSGPSSPTARRRSAASSRWRTPSPPPSGGCGRRGWSAWAPAPG